MSPRTNFAPPPPPQAQDETDRRQQERRRADAAAAREVAFTASLGSVLRGISLEEPLLAEAAATLNVSKTLKIYPIHSPKYEGVCGGAYCTHLSSPPPPPQTAKATADKKRASLHAAWERNVYDVIQGQVRQHV